MKQLAEKLAELFLVADGETSVAMMQRLDDVPLCEWSEEDIDRLFDQWMTLVLHDGRPQ